MPTKPSSEQTIKRNDSDRKGGRTYTLPDGEVVPSVTSILSVIGKPALVNWAAKTERELVLGAAADLNDDLPEKSPKMARIAYLATLEKRIGITKAHTRELAKAGEIGTQIHNLIEWNLRKELGQVVGPEPKVKDKALWGFMVYEEWRKKVSFTPRKIEQQVWSRRHKYAGTMDWLGDLTLDAEYAAKWGADPGTYLTVGDWKSGKAIYDEALMQTAAYVMAIIEMGHAKPPVNACIVRLPKTEADPEPDVLVIPWRYIPFLFQGFMAANALFQATKALSNRAEDGIPIIDYDPVYHLGEQLVAVGHAEPAEGVQKIKEALMIESSTDAQLMAKQAAEEATATPSGNGVPQEVPTTHAPFEAEPVEDDPFAPVKPVEGIPADVSERAEASDPNREGIPVAPVKVQDDVPVISKDEYESWLADRQATHGETVKRVADILHLSSIAYDSFTQPALLSAFKLSVEDRIALDERTASGKPTKARRKKG